jgi:ABC-2 type transport system permease protein
VIGHELDAVLALTVRDLKRFARDRSQILGALARPFLWLLFLGKGLHAAVPNAGGIDYQQYVFAGAIAMTVLFSGMFQGVTMIWDREFGFLKEVLVAPVSRITIVAGKTLAGAAVTFVQGLATIVFAPLVGIWPSAAEVGGLLLVTAILALAVTALGVAVASRMRTFEGFGVISNFVVLPLYLLSGGVFPLTRLPTWMSVLVHVNPTTYAVDLMRRSLGQPAAFSGLLAAGVLGGFTMTMGLFALVLFQREQP